VVQVFQAVAVVHTLVHPVRYIWALP
jgi:hypothetical protein